MLLPILLILAGVLSLVFGGEVESMAYVSGSKVLSLKQALLIGAVIYGAGAIIFGNLVSTTIREGFLTNVSTATSLSAMLGVLVWVVIALLKKWSISTTTSIVGAVVGTSLINKTAINYGTITNVMISWAISPIAAIITAYAFYEILRRVLFTRLNGLEARINRERYAGKILVIATLALMFVRGANDVSNSIGFIQGVDPFTLLLIGGFGCAAGIYFFSRGVTKNVGNNLVMLSPAACLAAMMAGALVIGVFTALRIPISSAMVLVSALVGASISKHQRYNKLLFKQFAFSWLVTLPASAAFSAAFTLALT